MPNALTPAGLTILSTQEIIAALTADLQVIYGADINLDPNSPDGQLLNIYAQTTSDLLELIADVYGTFSVAGAYGTVLDQRVAMNGIARKEGTYTTTPVQITVDRALTLYGLDQSAQTVYTIKDNAGNQFQLVTTHAFGGAGSATLSFRAVDIGQVLVTANTIQNQVTVVLGVTAVNNPTTTGTVNGTNEESDSQLKVRHAQSFALASSGPADSVAAALLAIPDITDAYVVENATPGTVDGTPANSIWVIVTGGTAVEIAQAIYAKKGLGCGMRGGNTQAVARPTGGTFTAKWDTSVSQDLYIKFNLSARIAGASFDVAALKIQLAAALIYKLGQNPTVGDVVNAMLALAPTGYLTNMGVSKDGIAWGDVVQPDDAQHYFTAKAANITISA